MTANNTSLGEAAPGLLTRERIIAKPGFNRWLVPPSGLAIHLCIGMAYGFSVFWLPLSLPDAHGGTIAMSDLTHHSDANHRRQKCS